MKTTISALAALLSATLVTFSQTPVPAPAPVEVNWVTKPLELPADNVELTDVNGRTITVTVLSKSREGLTIRNAEGKEFILAYRDLDTMSRAKITGVTGTSVTAPPAPQTQGTFAQRYLEHAKSNGYNLNSEAMKWNIALAEEHVAIEEFTSSKTKEELHKIRKAIGKLDAKALQEKMRNNDMECRVITRHLIANAEHEMAKSTTPAEKEKLPRGLKNVNYDRSATAIFLELDLDNPETPKEFSLRPKFEALGVTGIEQTGPECALAAVYNLARFAARDAGIKPQSKNALEAAFLANGHKKNQGMYAELHLISSIEKTYGKRPTVLEITGLTSYGSDEVAKHEIRSGRPVLAQISEANGQHTVILTGFKPSGRTFQPTEWEYLDSNHIHKNGGYKTTLDPNPNYIIHFK